MRSPTKANRKTKTCLCALLLVLVLVPAQASRPARAQDATAQLEEVITLEEDSQQEDPQQEGLLAEEPAKETASEPASVPESEPAPEPVLQIESEAEPAPEPSPLEVQSSDTSGTLTSGILTVGKLNAVGELVIPYSRSAASSGWPKVEVNEEDGATGTLTITSSDPSVAAVGSDHVSLPTNTGYSNTGYSYSPEIQAKKVGDATITATYTKDADGTKETVSFKVVCYPDYVTGVTATQASNASVRVSWKPFEGASGYNVYLEYYDDTTSNYVSKLAKTVSGPSATATTVAVPWGQSCYFAVLPYYKTAGTVYESPHEEHLMWYPTGTCVGLSVPYPTASKPTAKRAAYNKVGLTWKQCKGVTGYKVYRAKADEWGYATGDFTVVATQKGDTATSAKVTAPWDVPYVYAVRPYVAYDGKTFVDPPSSSYYSYDTSTLQVFALPRPTVRISSVTKASAKKLKVSWKAYAGATSYALYRSTLENSGYKKVATAKAGATSHAIAATPGTVYYFKVVATYGSAGKVTSGTFAQQIPAPASGAATKAKSTAIAGLGSWYNASYVYSYAQGSTTYVASLSGRKLTVQGYNKSLKRVSTKKVTLGAYEVLAGIYHGPDGNNYVVTGSYNYKQSKTKAVIKVTKYSKAWKKGKTATIKGGASNVFEGIYEPFRASSIALDMQGTTLYMMTGRTMFQTDDGLHHQSNIGFKINTKTMKAAVSNISYCSHSFGQRVRFKDGTLYVADHGDAFPRAMQLTWQEGYGTKAAKESQAFNAFEIVGATGDNYTGASLGGMEISPTNVLICGASVPQDYGVKGVKGAEYTLQRNLYLTVTNRATGKTTVKWLTTYHPKKKVGVTSVHMVKLSDQRFGILYEVSNNGKPSVRYLVVDDAGKKVLSRTIKGAALDGTAFPAFTNGRIVWASCDANYKGRLYSIQAM